MPRVYRPNTYNTVTHKMEHYPKIKWKETTRTERLALLAKRTASVAALAGFVVVVLPNGPVDILGDKGTKRSKSEMDALVSEKQQEIFAQDMSPHERYALSYLGTESICDDFTCWEQNSISVNGMKNNNGLLGYASVVFSLGGQNDIINESPGDECLAGSSYDSTPSEVRYGDVSAVASVNLLDGVISVYPAATEAPALSFDISDDGFLQPRDDVTIGILEAYDCEAEIKM